MKNLYSVFIFFGIYILFCSCNQTKSKGGESLGTEVTKSITVENKSDVKKDTELEDFGEFLKKFSDNESFQMRRIKFPINVIIPDTSDEGMAPTEEKINKYDWEPLDLNYDSTYLTRPYDQYYQVVRFRNDTAIVEIRGIDNGIYADYYFEMIGKKWYLVTLFEASF